MDNDQRINGEGAAWRVTRQDDNRFEVAVVRTRRTADVLAAEFEARGHKQMYWVETVRCDRKAAAII